MPKVHHVKKSRKPVPQLDLPAGSEYWWWGIMQGSRGVKRFSKTPPTRSQLTQSEFLGRVYDIEDQLNELKDPGDLESLISDIRELGEEQEEKYNNMPDGLQQGDTGQLLEGRASSCEEWASELEAVELPDDVDDSDVDSKIEEDYEEDERDDVDREAVRAEIEDERFEEFKDNVTNCMYNGE